MSTATSRPIGDNEFPVLLRLPDLNAPQWPPAVPVPVTTPANTARPVEKEPLPERATPAVSAATTVLATAPAATEVSKTDTKSQRESSTASTSVSTASVKASAEGGTLTMPRAERAARPQPPTAQWTLFRQLATGGVLVGGLALTYFLIMGGKDDSAKTPTADGPLVLPTTQDAVVVKADIPSPEMPPTFENFKPSPAPPPHIEVAERIENKTEPAPPPMSDTMRDARSQSDPSLTRPEPTTTPRDDRFIPRGRIGPDPVSVAAPRYPETDPTRYPALSRPGDSPAARAADRRAYPDTPYSAPSLPR